MQEDRIYFVYILASQINGTIYIGITNDLQRRIWEHKQGKIRGFTQKYGVDKLVYFEEFGEVDEAIQREKRLKKWKRAWKIRLIHAENPSWRDLSLELFGPLSEDFCG